MPPRTYRNLTPEELAELEAEFRPHAAVPRLPVSAASAVPWRVQMGGARLLDSLPGDDGARARTRVMLPETTITAGDGAKDAWLDELIGHPPSTPPRSMIRASGAGGDFTGEDTPESRELIKQRGMQVTEQSPPSDDDLLNALTSQRQATMPELGDHSVDDLISAESAKMDREQQAQQPAPAAAPRRSREDQLLDVIQPPTRAQGWLAVLGDALFGGHMVDNVNARAHGYEQARAQARMQDVASAERADEQAADRDVMDRRLALTERGQDLASQRGEENQYLRWLLAQQQDKRVREEGAAGRGAAMERAELMAHSRADAGAPNVTPEEKSAGAAGWLSQQANVPLAKANAYVAGDREGLTPEELERLDANYAQWKIASSKTQQSMIGKGTGREGATPDSIWRAGEAKRQDPKLRLAIKNDLTAQNTALNAAVKAWKELSPSARAAIAKIGPNGDLAEAGMSPEDQARAAHIQALANFDIKQAAGSAVTGSEWKRIAGEIGLPDGISAFKSPQVLDRWLRQHIDLFKKMQGNALSEFPDLFEEGP